MEKIFRLIVEYAKAHGWKTFGAHEAPFAVLIALQAEGYATKDGIEVAPDEINQAVALMVAFGNHSAIRQKLAKELGWVAQERGVRSVDVSRLLGE